MPNGTYYVFKDGEEMRGGMLQAPSSDIPTMWLQYITVEDCDETLARAKKNGATVIAEPDGRRTWTLRDSARSARRNDRGDQASQRIALTLLIRAGQIRLRPLYPRE